jgi:hypothetical protein
MRALHRTEGLQRSAASAPARGAVEEAVAAAAAAAAADAPVTRCSCGAMMGLRPPCCPAPAPHRPSLRGQSPRAAPSVSSALRKPRPQPPTAAPRPLTTPLRYHHPRLRSDDNVVSAAGDVLPQV